MFSHREFSFTLEDDVYVRYQSFDSQQALEDGVRKNRPYKIDIGAIFSVKVCVKEEEVMEEVEEEDRDRDIYFSILQYIGI